MVIFKSKKFLFIFFTITAFIVFPTINSMIYSSETAKKARTYLNNDESVKNMIGSVKRIKLKKAKFTSLDDERHRQYIYVFYLEGEFDTGFFRIRLFEKNEKNGEFKYQIQPIK